MSKTRWQEERLPCHLSCLQTSPPGSFPPRDHRRCTHRGTQHCPHPSLPTGMGLCQLSNGEGGIGTLPRGQGEVSMRTPTPRCLLMLQPFSSVPITYSHPISGFGNQVRSADRAPASLGFRQKGWLGTEGSPWECGASRFYSGRDAKAEHSCRNRGFPHEQAAVPLPLPSAEHRAESGESLHIPPLHPNSPLHGGEASNPTTNTSTTPNSQGWSCVSIAAVLVNYPDNLVQC